nr:class I SAM-dependent DNA methyltransferase [Verrucomicrobiota bacterium]
YNVLEKLRAADGPRAVPVRSAAPETATPENSNASESVHPLRTGTVRAPSKDLLTAKEKLIHDHGLVSVLKQLHDDLDRAVFAAYGWPGSLTDAEILERLVALNAERAAEEKRGVIHWLRPEYQTRGQKAEGRKQKELSLPEGKSKPKAKAKARADARPTGRKTEWPKSLAERVQAVEAALHRAGKPVAAAELAKQFKRARPENVAEILETLVTLGRAHPKGNQFTR